MLIVVVLMLHTFVSMNFWHYNDVVLQQFFMKKKASLYAKLQSFVAQLLLHHVEYDLQD